MGRARGGARGGCIPDGRDVSTHEPGSLIIVATGLTRGGISAAKSHRVELANHPVDSILSPEWLPLHDEGRHSEDLVAIRLGKARIEVGARVAIGVFEKTGRVEADLR